MSRVHEMLELLNLLEKQKNWLQYVKTKWHPPEGIFKKSPEEIAKVFFKASIDLRQAMSRLNFAANRAGWCNPESRNYNPKLCKNIEKAKELVRKLFAKKGAKEAADPLLRDLLAISSGTLGTIFGKKSYDEIDKIQSDLIDYYMSNVDKKGNRWKTWKDVVKDFCKDNKLPCSY